MIATQAHECRLPSKEEMRTGSIGVILWTSVISYIVPVFVIVYVAIHTYLLLRKSKKLKLRVLRVGGNQDPSTRLSGKQKTSTSSIFLDEVISSSSILNSSVRRGSPLLIVKERALSVASFHNVTRKISLATSRLSTSFESEKIPNSPNLALRKRVVEIRKISRFVMLMAVAFTVTILPFGVLSVIRMFTTVDSRSWRVACILAYLSSALNPLCYAFGNKNFNEAFRRILKKRSSGGGGVEIRKRKLEKISSLKETSV